MLDILDYGDPECRAVIWEDALPTATSTPTLKPTADVNHDGVINMADVVLIATAFDTTIGDSRYNATYDLNNDGSVNMLDIIILATKFNEIVVY